MSFFFSQNHTEIISDDRTITKKTTRTIKHENFSKMKILKVDRWALSLIAHFQGASGTEAVPPPPMRWPPAAAAQWSHDAIITSLWRQNDVATSFRRHNDIIIASCARCEVLTGPSSCEIDIIKIGRTLNEMKMWPKKIVLDSAKVKKGVKMAAHMYHQHREYPHQSHFYLYAHYTVSLSSLGGLFW